MKTKTTMISLLLGIFTLTSVAQSNSIDYFGQTPPGDTAIVFAPGIISLTDRLEGKIAFSPDGSECYFTVWGARFSSCKILYTKRVNNKWTEPVEAPFSVDHYTGEPFISADGNRLYFDYSVKGKGTSIWMVQRTAQGWSEPRELPDLINAGRWNAGYSETKKGIAYFNSNCAGGYDSKGDVWRIRHVLGQPDTAENLGAIVNSTGWDAGSIAPDESYIIFTSERPGGHGFSDLYISLRNKDGNWSDPVNMEKNGAGINITSKYVNETDPYLSPDGRFLFFSRHIFSQTGETQDIYWISTKVIDDIKNKPRDRGLLQSINR